MAGPVAGQAPLRSSSSRFPRRLRQSESRETRRCPLGLRLARPLWSLSVQWAFPPSHAPTASTHGLAKELFRDLRHTLWLESEFAQQLLKRSRCAERLHADDAAGLPADITFPAER